MSDMSNSMVLLTCIVLGFSVIYASYISMIGDEFNLHPTSSIDIVLSSFYLSTFVTAGTIPGASEPKSLYAKMVVTSHCLLALIAKVWIVSALVKTLSTSSST